MMDVTNEQLLIDIENTKKEMEAYKKLYEGYEELATLPENKNEPTHNHRAMMYRSIHDQCFAFLRKLERIKEDRGL